MSRKFTHSLVQGLASGCGKSFCYAFIMFCWDVSEAALVHNRNLNVKKSFPRLANPLELFNLSLPQPLATTTTITTNTITQSRSSSGRGSSATAEWSGTRTRSAVALLEEGHAHFNSTFHRGKQSGIYNEAIIL